MSSRIPSQPPDRDPDAMDPDAAATVFDFVQHYLDDRASGQEKPIAHYLALYPGHDDLVRQEHTRMQASDGAESPPAESIGHYRLIRELGRGGQGSVWLAEDEGLRRPVALKLLNSWLIAGERMARFRREAESIAKLEHEGLAVVYEADMDSPQPYIAMRFVDGEDLSSLLSQTDPLEKRTLCKPNTPAAVRETLLFFERAARALHAAHEAGVVHRDIKPSNLMVTREGRPVVTDFGLAQDEFTPGEETITREGEIFGTPAYMSPEQIAGKSGEIDRRTDVWSLGATLFETLCGKPPFHGKGQIGLAKAILEDPIPNLRQLPSGKVVSHDLWVVVQTAMERDLERRYGTALEFAEDLRRIREYEPIQALPASPWLRLRRWCRREPAWATALTLTFLALVGGLVFSQFMLGRITTLLEKERSMLERITNLRDTERSLLDKERSLRFVRRVPSIMEVSPSQALAVGLEAVRLDNSWISRSSLFGPLESNTLSARGDVPTNRRTWDAGYLRNGTTAFGAGEHGIVLLDPISGKQLAIRRFAPPSDSDDSRYSALEVPTYTVLEVVEDPRTSDLVVSLANGTIHRLDGKSLESVWEVRFGELPIQSIVHHPTQSQVLALTLDDGAKLLDIETGDVVRSFPIKAESAALVRFARNGSVFLACSRTRRGKPRVANSIASIWDTNSGTKIADLRHGGIVRDACTSPDGQKLATCTAKGEVIIWSAKDGTRMENLPHLDVGAETLCYSPDGKQIAVGTTKGVRLWNVEGRTWTVAEGPPDQAVVHVAYDRTGEQVAGCCMDTVLRVWDAQSGEVVHEHRQGTRTMLVRWAPDGQHLLSAGISAFAYFWSAIPNNSGFRFEGPGDPMIWAEFLPDAQKAIVADAQGRIWLIRTPSGEGRTDVGSVVRKVAEGGEGKLHLALASKSGHLAVGDGRNVVWVHDLVGVSETLEFHGFPRGVHDIAISPNAERIAVIDGLGRASLLDTHTKAHIPLETTRPQIKRIRFDGDGRFLAAGDHLGVVLVWDAQTGALLRTGDPDWSAIHTSRYPVVDLEFSADGKDIYAATDPWFVHRWSVSDPSAPEFRDKRLWHRWLRVLPQGGAITLGTGAGSFRPDLANIAKRPDVRHERNISAFDLNAAGTRIATGSEDHKVLVWDLNSGSTLIRFDRHEGPIRHIAFSHLEGDDRVLSASDDGTVALWLVNPAPAARTRAPHGLSARNLQDLQEWGSGR